MTRTAGVYGEALWALAREEGLEDRLLSQLETVTALFAAHPRYVRLLDLPSAPKAQRCALLDESLGQAVHPYLLHLLKLLAARSLVRRLPDCAEAFRRRCSAARGLLDVTAVTAVPLDGGRQEALRRRLVQRTGREVRLRTRVDPAVLGGVRLETEGRCLDGTVRRRLDDLQALLRGTIL